MFCLIQKYKKSLNIEVSATKKDELHARASSRRLCN